MFKGKKGVLLLLVLLLIISACERFGVGSKDKEQTQTAFVGGSNALTVAFVDNEPPVNVLDAGQQDFYITLLVKNEGEFTIPKGKILASLSGVSREAFGLSNLNVKSNFDLDGVTKEISGGIEELEFGLASYKPDLPADFLTNMRADVCYDYETDALATLCLRKNLFERDINGVCDVNQEGVNVENSGGPVQVQNLKVSRTGPNQMRVLFDVVNAGQGGIYEPNAFSNVCGGQENKKDMVKVKLSSPANRFKISCSRFSGSEGVVRLVNGIKTVSCTVDTSTLQEATFEDLLQINVKYMYRDAISVPLTIENAAS